MAYKNIKGITVEIGGDTTKLGQALENINKKSNNLQGELREIERLLKLDPTNTELLCQKQKNLAETLKNTKERLDILKEAEKQVQEQFAKGDVTEEQVRALQREIVNASLKFDKCEKEAKETASAIYDVGKSSDESANDVEKLNDQAVHTEDAFKKADIAFGTFIGNLASDAVKNGVNKVKEISKATLDIGKNFTSTMSEVQAIFNASESETELLTKTARKYGAETAFSATESAEALKYMAMAGWDVNQSIEALPAVLDLAIASGEDLGSTSDIVTDALTAYSLQAKDSTHFTDVLAAASSNANTNVSLMGQTFKYVAPVAGAMGYNIEDSAIAIGLMANAGIKGTQSGTQLRAILASMANPSEKNAKAMDALGLSLTHTDGSMKSLDEIILNLRSSFGKLNEAQSAETASCLVGREAMSGLLAIVKASDKDYNKLKKSIYNCNNAASNMSKTMKNNLSGDLKELNSAWEEFELKIYSSVEEPLRDIVQFATNKLLPLLTKGSRWVKSNIPQITSTLAGLTGGFLTYKGTVAAAELAHNGLKKTIEATTVAQKILNGVQKMTPLGMVATLAGMAATAIGTYLLTADKATESTSSLTEAEQKLVDEVNESAKSFKEQQETTNKTVGGIQSQMSHLSDLMDELDKYVGKNGEVKESDQERVKFLLGEYKDATGEEIKMVDGVIKNYDKLKKSIKEVIKSKTANAMLEARKEDYLSALENEREAWEAKELTIDEYNKAMNEAIQSQADLKAAEEEYNKALMRGIESEYSKANELFYTKTQQHKEAMQRLHNADIARDEAVKNYEVYGTAIIEYEEAMAQVQKGNYDAAISMMQGKTKAQIDYVDNVDEAEKNLLASLKKEADDAEIYTKVINDHFKDGSDEMVKDAEEKSKKANIAFELACNAISDNIDAATVRNLKNLQEKAIDAGIAAKKIKYKFDNGLDGVGEKAVKDADKNFKDMINQYTDAYIKAEIIGGNFTAGLSKGIQKGQPMPIKQAIKTGEYISQGLADGIEKKRSELVEKINSVVNAVVIGARQAADIHSPSRKTKKIGGYMGEGLKVGIEEKTKTVKEAAKEQIEQILAAYNKRYETVYQAFESVQAATRQNSTVNIPEPINTLPVLNQILSAVKQGQIIALDSDAIVGGTADKMNIALGKQRILNTRKLK